MLTYEDTHPKSQGKDDENSWMLENIELEGRLQIPKIKGVYYRPKELLRFDDAYKKRNTCDYFPCIHFYEQDREFKRVWDNPLKYVDLLKHCEAVISPDFSLYKNKATIPKMNCVYKNQLLGAWWQTLTINTIPNVRLSGIDSLSYALCGMPHNSTIAIGLVSTIKNTINRAETLLEIKYVIDVLQPTNIIFYGTLAYGLDDELASLGVEYQTFPNQNHNERKEVKHGETRTRMD